MEERESDVFLMDKLIELNELEIKKSKVLAAIFQKTMDEMEKKKLQSLDANFEEQAKFYDQYLEDYEKTYQEMKNRYEEQLSQILEQYQELFVNLYLELQEAECNQKIAITNWKKSYDIKQEILNKANSSMIEEYDRKIEACIQKKQNYDIIIEECEKELEKCATQMEKRVNSLFQDKSSQMFLTEISFFGKIMNKIKNIFTGKSKFNTYVMEPMKVELEMIETKLPDIIENMEQEMVTFVARIKQAKAETNQIFEQMI